MNSPASNPQRELRQSKRRELLGNAIFIALDVKSRLAATLDLSTGGLSLTLPQPLTIGQACAITFDVPSDTQKQRALISGRVASCVPSGETYRIGIRFVQADAVSKQLIQTAVEQYLATEK